MSDTTVLDQLLGRIDSLYTLPAVAVEVLRLTDESKGSVDYPKLKHVIERDPAIVAKVMRAANSPLFGFGREVSSLTEALSILGTQALKGIVLSFSLPTEFVEDTPEDLLQEYWQRTVARSVAARQCAKRLQHSNGEELFVAGVMADIGVLALTKELGETYLHFVQEAKQSGQDLSEMETASLGFDHRVLASRLMQQWNLPDSLSSIVGSAHLLKPNSKVPDSMFGCGVLFAADMAANLLLEKTEKADELLETCENFFQWESDTVQQWLESVEKPIQAFAELLELHISVAADYPALLNEASQRRAEVLAGSAAENPFGEENGETSDTDGEASSNGISTLERTESAMESTLDQLDHNVDRWAESETEEESFSMFGDPNSTIDQQPSGSFQDWSDDPGLIGRVSMAVQNARMNRQPLSLILAQIDDFNNVVFSESVDGIYKIQQSITILLKRLCRDENGEVIEVTDEQFAVLLPGLERVETTRMGNSILQLIRHWSLGRSQQNHCPVSLSLGCASAPIPAKNFDPKTLISAAQRCLEAVQLGTGNAMKSIDVFY